MAIKQYHYKERATELAIGVSAKSLISGSFDWFLYPAVIYWLGPVKGGVVMTLLSMLACIGMMKFYDWSKRDWLGIEAMKGLREYEGTKRLGKLTAWVLTKGDFIIFLFLCINLDPFITTTYMRHGRNNYGGMGKRDWLIFISSVIVGNVYWTLAVFMGISLFEWVWKAVAG
ncbi:MAG: hypothetical protein HZB31_06160 [Nitrospirae bacterium]|nr:hypothetical protein [Nitrospirota bacterium]